MSEPTLADELREVGYTAPAGAEHRMDVLSDDERTTVIVAADRIAELEARLRGYEGDTAWSREQRPDGGTDD